jgi:hypothetical protein
MIILYKMILSDEELRLLIDSESPCMALNVITESICLTPITEDKYGELAPYRNEFIKHISKDASCYRGTMYISVSTHNSEYKWATVYIDDEIKGVCSDKISSMKRLIIAFAPFSDTSRTDPTMMTNEYITYNEEEKATIHTSMLLYNRNKIKRIEPDGSAPWDDIVDNTLEKYFSANGLEYEYTPTWASCPIGVELQNSGRDFCANWSLMIAYILIKCQGITYEELQEQLAMHTKEPLYKLVDHWSCFMEQYIKQHGIWNG